LDAGKLDDERLGLNRTSVGLKLGHMLIIPLTVVYSLNRTSVGLKLQKDPAHRFSSFPRLNRTSVGLKRGIAWAADQGAHVASIEPAWD
jgi:hypothetical protein